MMNAILKNKKKSIFIALLLSVLIVLSIFLVSCINDTDDPYNQEPGVAEPDIVKVTDDGYIIKLQHDGMTVTKTDNGKMEVVKTKYAPNGQTPIDLIGYGKYMIAVIAQNDNFIQLQYYDMVDLNDGTNRIEPVRTTSFYGTYFTCRIYENTLYFFAKSNNTYYRYDEVKETTVYEDKEDYLYDTVEGLVKFERIDTNQSSYGYLFTKLSLDNIAQNKYTATSCKNADISSLYFSLYGVYMVIPSSQQDGCTGNPAFSLVRLSLDTLTIYSKSETYTGTVINRYCMYDNGERLFIVSYYNSTSLTVFDYDFKQTAKLTDLAPYEQVQSVRYQDDFCYIVTFRTVDPLFKIDITKQDKPKISGYEKSDGFSTSLYKFGNSYLIGVGYTADLSSVQATLFDITGDDPYEANILILDVQDSQSASDLKAACTSFENNIFALSCSDGVRVLGLDNYSYLEQKARLKNIDAEKNETTDSSFSIFRIALIGDYLYTISDKLIASYSISDFALSNVCSTIIG